jgi:hypothetical protein
MKGKGNIMGMKQLELAVLYSVREVAKDKTIRLKDIMEWSTGEVKVQEGETLYKLPDLGIECAVLNKDKRRK